MSLSEGNKFELPTKVIGYWLSEKKCQKLNWTEFSAVCRKRGYELVKLDLDVPLEEQGPFTVIIHKLTDFIAKTLRNDEKAIRMIKNVEEYVDRHEEVAVLDPISNVKKLLDRYSAYRAIRDSQLNKFGIFTPAFVELNTDDQFANLQKLKKASISFPIICKSSVSHGSTDCHEMAVIFNEAGLKDCRQPCVAQSFVNHNALLFKVYVLGDQYYVTERPSLKNFYPSDQETIFFNSHDVSKSDSTSSLSILDPDEEVNQQLVTIDPEKVKAIVHTLTRILGMSLLGIDIVVENDTGRYAIIDINSYPGYDGYPNFFDHLLNCIDKTVDDHQKMLSKRAVTSTSPSLKRTNLSNNTASVNQLNGVMMENGVYDCCLKNEESSEDNSIVNDDDILNSNQNNNGRILRSNKNVIVVSNEQGDSQRVNGDKEEKRNQQNVHQRVRTVTAVSGKKSIERQL